MKTSLLVLAALLLGPLAPLAALRAADVPKPTKPNIVLILADGTGIYTLGPSKGLQAHTNFVLERSWVHSRLDNDIPAPPYKKEQFVQDMKAGIAHGIVPSVNLEIYQDVGVGEASLEYMKAVRQELNKSI